MDDSGAAADGEGARPDAAQQRVGTVEREAAISALNEHFGAGRLEAPELEERLGRAMTARVRADLDALFTDLPGPSPLPPPTPFPVPAWPAAGSSPTPATPAPVPAQASGPLGGRVGQTLVALAPLVALVLFFRTGTWLWFLLVPALGIVVYGGQGRPERDR